MALRSIPPMEFFKNLSMPSGQPTTLKDGGGLTVMVRADGVGRWRLRCLPDVRENRLSLGIWSRVASAAAAARLTRLVYLMNQT